MPAEIPLIDRYSLIEHSNTLIVEDSNCSIAETKLSIIIGIIV